MKLEELKQLVNVKARLMPELYKEYKCPLCNSLLWDGVIGSRILHCWCHDCADSFCVSICGVFGLDRIDWETIVKHQL